MWLMIHQYMQFYQETFWRRWNNLQPMEYVIILAVTGLVGLFCLKNRKR
jgi:hypothetical protein